MRFKRILMGSVAIVGAGMAIPALAQTVAPSPPAQSEDTGQLTDIIVTARRSSENLQRVPVSVTAISGTEIAEKHARTVEDLTLGTPSVSITPATSTKNAATISIRGQVQTDNQITLDPSVGLYVDDIYYARAYAALGDLLDVSNVQVLKGPQGTLYGRNTIGGAIKIETNKADPTTPIGGYVRASYGNFNAVDASGAINIPIVTDVLAVRFAASYHRHDGYTHSFLVPADPATGVSANLTPTRKIDTDDQNSNSQRLSIRFTPTNNFSVDIAGYRFLSKDNGVLTVNLNGDIQNYSFDSTPASFTTSPQRRADFYSALTNTVPFSYTKINSINSVLAWEISDALTAKIILGYVEAANHARLNTAGTVNAGLDYFDFQVALDAMQHQKSGEFQLSGNLLGDKLKYVAGLYYFDENGHEESPNTLVYSFDTNLSSNPVGDAHNISKSVFANAGYAWTDRFHTTVGLRYTSDIKELVGHNRYTFAGSPGTCEYGPGPNIVTSTNNGGPCSFAGRTGNNYVTYEVSSDFRVTSDIFLYAKIGNGVRSGGLNLRGVGGITLSPYQPDKLVNYEAGIKSELFDRRLRVNVSAYHSDYSNIQQVGQAVVANSLGQFSVVGYTQNTGSAKINGIELDSNARLGTHLTLSGGFGYSHFRYDTPGLVQPEAPEWTYQIGGDYKQTTPLGEAVLALTYSGKSSFYMATNLNPDVPQGKVLGYGLLDGRLGVALNKSLSVSAFGKNLLARKYYSQGFEVGYNPGPAFGFYGLRSMNIGAPRTFGLELEAKF